ncbi:MAG: zinc-binding dehydrogenase [Woeseiaceae bacterium]|nr:zinc-binding dehydrogenase [Woeseiaceae bacterium]NIP20604.1 zinc-binding dehydrogenase [Woeseiaceae bacterium]NIS89397.1 zinc-binding dehydrogenase [Woeseiaceae bacterium]
MKAITYERYGPPEVLRISDVQRPEPGDHEVLVRVRAAEATKADCEMRSFRFAVNWFWLPMRLAMGLTRPRRKILGIYFAGEVAGLGADVSRFSVGDEVFGAAGLRMGAYGEYVAVSETNTIVPKPADMSFAEAAAVPLGGLNALHFMRLADIKPGESVLINGAGGSIGLHAVQIAKAMGAEVTAVDKSLKESLVRRMGADNFVDYTKQSFADAGQRYDVVFDMVPTSSFGACMRVLKEHGRYLTGNPRLSVMLRCLWASKVSNKKASFAFARETREELLALKEMIESGSVRSIVDEVMPMEQAAEAHHRVEDETRLGAIVISIA